MLKWDRRYEVGHERIDAEHKIFLGLIVSFHEATEQGASKEKLIRILNEITKYADFHFISEENIMMDHHYPNLQDHAKLHFILQCDLRDKFHLFKADKIPPQEVFDFLFYWFALHTSSEDKKLARYIEG